MTTDMPSTIEVSDLRKAYPGGIHALDGVSFAVENGSVFALLGANGAGKSTTVKILTTLARPDAGNASVAGFDVLRDAPRVRRAIGVVAQASGLDAQATARENLRLQGQVFGLGGRELENTIDSLLGRFGLTDAADRLVRTFSGGMRRRLDVALALVHGPRVLFLDEPTTGLDPEVRSEMWSEIRRLTEEEAMTVLLTTHYLEEADELAARVAIVDRGRVVVEGTPEELKRELRGDAIQVEFEGPLTAGVDRLLRGLGGIDEIQANGAALRARARDGARAVPAVLQALEAGGVTVASVTVARPSLDDVYLRYAGRTIGAAEAARESRTNGQEASR